MRKVLAILAIASLNVGCSEKLQSEYQTASACAEYSRKLDTVSADHLFAQRISAGTAKFLGVYGYTLSFPGLEEMAHSGRKLATKQGYSVIEGTTDNIQDAGCEKFQTEAWNYAKTYNHRLKVYLAEKDRQQR